MVEMNRIQLPSWDIFDLSEQVSPLVIDAMSDEVYHRDYGDAVALGWPRKPDLDTLGRGGWWR